jgi:WD40 repeat protein
MPNSPIPPSTSQRRNEFIPLNEPIRWEIKPDPPISLNIGTQPYRDVSLSPTCRTLALVEPQSFKILAVSTDITKRFTKNQFSPICVGYSDGRYGKPKGPFEKGGACKLSYMMGTLSDERLCMIGHADRNNLIIFNSQTGQFIRSKKLSHPCYKIVMSQNGGLLAMAFESGDLSLYPIGSDGHFDTIPISVIKRKKQTARQWLVKCMSMSPDSGFICVCSDDDVIRTYQIDLETTKAEMVSIYDTELSYPEMNHGICDLALYLPNLKLLMTATHRLRDF